MPFTTQNCAYCKKPILTRVTMGEVFTEEGKHLTAEIFDSPKCANIVSFYALPFFESVKAQELFMEKHPRKWKKILESKKQILIIKKEA